jgi:RHS repeat-associated protein
MSSGRAGRAVFRCGGLTLERPAQRIPSRSRTATDPNGHPWTVETAEGRLLGVVEPDGARTRYQRDAAGRLTARTDALGRTTRYAYDEAGRLVRTVWADGASLACELDAEGRLARRALPGGRGARFERSAEGRLEAVVFGVAGAGGAGGRVSFAWDEEGRLVAATEPGCVTRWSYGADGRVEALVREIDGVHFTLRLDDAGRVASLVLPGGEAVDLTAPAGRPEAAPREELRLDGLGNVVARGEHELAYDPCGQLIEVRGPEGVTRYEYDAVGNRTARSGPDGTTVFTYDGRDRLAAALGPGGSRDLYEHDEGGHLTRKATAGADRRFEHDARGRLAAVDRNGRPVVRYRHDFLGRRIARRSGGVEVLYHRGPDGRVVAITHADGRLIAAFPAGGTVRRGPDGATFFLETDHLGSTRRIVDAAGNLVWQGDYTPFGRLVGAPPPFECPLFTGHFLDPETGIYDCGLRDYDPETARFLSPDPWTGGPDDVRLLAAGVPGEPPVAWLALPKGANPYAYCLNNPLSWTDPDGLSVLGTIGKTVLAFLWSSVWTVLGASVMVVDWIFQYLLFGWAWLPDYGIDGVSSGRLGSAAVVNVGGLGPSPLVLANILFARRGLVDDLNGTALEYVVPVEADRRPRELRTGRTAYFEHLLRHTVQANYSGPFWPFVYLFAGDAMEKDAVRESGFTTIAAPVLTVVPEKILTSQGTGLIAIGGQKPYTFQLSNAAAGAVGPVTDQPRFSEARIVPTYRPGDHSVTVRDNAGISDTRSFEIARLRISDIEVTWPAGVRIDDISDPDIPTLRLVDGGGVTRGSANVHFEVSPEGGELFFEVVAPPAPARAPLTVTPATGIGSTTVSIALASAPASHVPEDFMLRVRAWNQQGDVLRQVRVRALSPLQIVLQSHIVRKDDGSEPAADLARMTQYLTVVNRIWSQAGVQFSWRANILFVDETDFLEISIALSPNPGQAVVTEHLAMFRWRSTAQGGPIPAPAAGAPRNDLTTQDAAVIHVYWIDDFNQAGDSSSRILAFAGRPSNYLVMSRSASAPDMAHELGHCLGLPHPDHQPVVPRQATKRVMYSESGSEEQRFLIANQEPGRALPSGDETATARTQAILRLGP